VSFDICQEDKRQYGDGCYSRGVADGMFESYWYGRRQSPHRGYEAVASPGDCFNVLVRFAQPLSKKKDVVREAAFFDERIRPKRLDQIVFFRRRPLCRTSRCNVSKAFGESATLFLPRTNFAPRDPAKGAKFIKPRRLLTRRNFRNWT
jgi:hypothetical protein